MCPRRAPPPGAWLSCRPSKGLTSLHTLLLRLSKSLSPQYSIQSHSCTIRHLESGLFDVVYKTLNSLSANITGSNGREKSNGGSRGVGVLHPQLSTSPQSSSSNMILVHDPPALWDQVHILENVVPAPVLSGRLTS
ncbi:hypothetical protein Tco_0359054 [Tanacetum coccineum]